jgi:hypothetical protein
MATLRLHWKLNETDFSSPPTTIADSSGNGYDGIAPSSLIESVATPSGFGIEGQGAAAGQGPTDISKGTSITFAFWARVDQSLSHLMHQGFSRVNFNEEGIVCSPTIGGANTLTTSFEWSGWHWLVITQSGTTAKVYLDSVLIDTGTGLDTVSTDNTFGTFIEDEDGINDLRIYAGELNQTEIDAIYDSNAITPNPATWEDVPAAVAGTEDSITMKASFGEASAPLDTSVEYYFYNLTDPTHDSGWQSSQTYTDTGLTVGVEYTYTLQLRSKTYLNTGSLSTEESATVVDTEAPRPDPATFLQAPIALDDDRIFMSATVGTDASTPIEYRFAETSGNPGGSTQDWSESSSFIDSGLDPDTTYTYTVQMRDAVPNTGTASAPASATTDAAPSTDPVLIHHWPLDEKTLGGINFITDDIVGGTGIRTLGGSLNPIIFVQGVIDNAARTEGTQDMFNLVTQQIIDDQAVSISFWFRSSGSTNMGVFSFSKGVSYYECILDENLDFHFKNLASATATVGTDDEFNDGSWHHAVIVITDTVGIKLYIDSNLDNTVADNTMLAAKEDMTTGKANNNSDTNLIGDLDDIRIYSGILTDQDISDLYDEGITGWQLNDNYNGYNADYEVDRAGREANDKYGNTGVPEDERLNNVYGKNNDIYDNT